MTSIAYDDIYSYFLGNITDFTFATIDVEDAKELMSEYLHKAASIPYIRTLFSSLILNDEESTVSYEMTYVTNDSYDLDFTKNVLSKGMVVEWLTPQVRSKINISQVFAGKEQKFYSQSNHISELRGMLEDVQLELKKIIRDRGYINNSYLEE